MSSDQVPEINIEGGASPKRRGRPRKYPKKSPFRRSPISQILQMSACGKSCPHGSLITKNCRCVRPSGLSRRGRKKGSRLAKSAKSKRKSHPTQRPACRAAGYKTCPDHKFMTKGTCVCRKKHNKSRA
jgi:hypothetical protein